MPREPACGCATCCVLSAQDVRSVQSTVLCRSVLCIFVRGALRCVPVRQKAHASQVSCSYRSEPGEVGRGGRRMF